MRSPDRPRPRRRDPHRPDLTGCRTRTATFTQARFAGAASFTGAQFTSDASFAGSQFTGKVRVGFSRRDGVRRCVVGLRGVGLRG
ncbi:pentapeptide repeat-containing protein [Actinophytocola sp.]|uniref:pentapeptide repeat-containing protein n=1 Tax=Actinophytocola sp. TaxID=1872138 RepID=UPI0039C895B7